MGMGMGSGRGGGVGHAGAWEALSSRATGPVRPARTFNDPERSLSGRRSSRMLLREGTRMAAPDPALERLRQSHHQRVKVALADIDGVLRGKYLHRDKFLSGADG